MVGDGSHTAAKGNRCIGRIDKDDATQDIAKYNPESLSPKRLYSY